MVKTKDLWYPCSDSTLLSKTVPFCFQGNLEWDETANEQQSNHLLDKWGFVWPDNRETSSETKILP